MVLRNCVYVSGRSSFFSFPWPFQPLKPLVQTCVCVCVCACVCLPIYACAYLCLRVCVSMYVGACVFFYICPCVFLRTHTLRQVLALSSLTHTHTLPHYL